VKATVGREPTIGTSAVNDEFQAVYHRHWRFVWRIAGRLGAPEHAREDIVQEVFAICSEQLGGFRGDAKIESWLFAITKNKVMHLLRGQSRHRRKVDALAAEQGPGPASDPYARLDAVDELYGALDQLDDGHRDVFVLAEMEQLSASEVAEILHININTVYSRLRTANTKMRQLLESARKAAS
jgi:RNA polymerase sigma-70 factor (ECF subfamily)